MRLSSLPTLQTYLHRYSEAGVFEYPLGQTCLGELAFGQRCLQRYTPLCVLRHTALMESKHPIFHLLISEPPPL